MCDAAPRVRSPFPPPPLRSPAPRRAGEQLRPRGETRSERAERGDTAALCPTGEEQPRRSQPREGGWAAAWGGVSGSRQWLPRRPGGSPPSASPTPAGSSPRPLVRPGARPGRVDPPRGAGLGDPSPPALHLSRPLRRAGPRPGRFYSVGPPAPEGSLESLWLPPPFLVRGTPEGASACRFIRFWGRREPFRAAECSDKGPGIPAKTSSC